MIAKALFQQKILIGAMVKFLNDFKYKIYDDKLISLNIETLINRIGSLDQSHQTIGNYFLIKDFSYVYKKLFN